MRFITHGFVEKMALLPNLFNIKGGEKWRRGEVEEEKGVRVETGLKFSVTCDGLTLTFSKMLISQTLGSERGYTWKRVRQKALSANG
jgi:hypothetical protein